MNEDKLCFNLKMIKKFINYSLGLSDDKFEITGYDLLSPLLNAVAYNTYVETIGNKADTLYLRCKDSLISMMQHAYLNYLRGVSNKFKLKQSLSSFIGYYHIDFFAYKFFRKINASTCTEWLYLSFYETLDIF